MPQGAGVGSAIGFLRAQISYEVVRTRYMDLREFVSGRINELFTEMRAEAEAVAALHPVHELLHLRLRERRHGGRRSVARTPRGRARTKTFPLPSKKKN